MLETMWIIWLIAAAVFLGVEAMTAGLISIWLVPGAVVTSILSIFVKNIGIQVLVFMALSAALIFLCRKYFNKTSAEKLDDTDKKPVGKTATAQTAINDLDGKVLLGDVYWRAVSDSEIPEGEAVVITAVNGNILTVTKK